MKTPEIELLPGRKYWGDFSEAFPAEIAPEKGTFLFIYIASGMKSAHLHLADGRNPYRASGRLSESVMLVLPPNAVFISDFEMRTAEAFLFPFVCPDLHFDWIRPRLLLSCPDGSKQPVDLYRRLSMQEVAVFRPATEKASTYSLASPGSGRYLRGLFLFESLFSRLFSEDVREGDGNATPAQRLEKILESNPRGTTIKALAKQLGRSQNGLRKKFREIQGHNPQIFKTRQTLHLARYYIIQTKLPFKEIALRLGFSSASYFSAFIRHNVGRTPREIRASRRWRGPYRN